MDAPLRFRFRHALYTMGSRFEFQAAVHTIAVHPRDDLFVATDFRLAGRHELNLPALLFRIAALHPPQVADHTVNPVAAIHSHTFQAYASAIRWFTRPPPNPP